MEQEGRPRLVLVAKTMIWPVTRVEVWYGDVELERVYAIGFSRAAAKGARVLLKHFHRMEDFGAAREPKDVTGRLDGGYA